METKLIRNIVLFLALAISFQLNAQVAPPGNALSLDGADDYVDCGNGASLNITGSITIEAWINADTWKTNQWDGTIAGKDNTDGTGYVLRCGDNGRLSFALGSNGNWYEVVSDQIMITGQWYHVAGVYDGSMMRIYINGVLSGQKSLSSSIGISAQNLYIGNSPGYPERVFSGMIDEVRIWNVDRSACQINENLNRSLTGKETGLAACHNFDQGTAGEDNTGSTTLPDITSNANNGTLNNFALNGATSNWVASGAGATSSAPDVIVATTGTANLTSSSIDINGNITSISTGSVTERGVCYNTSGCPTTVNSKKSENSGPYSTGTFTERLSGLTPGTVYYARAYAINSTGIGYGSPVMFNTCIVNIPDANFKAALLAISGLDANGNGIIECTEAAAYTGAIDVHAKSISDMTGIEAFTKASSLNCNSNTFTTINLTSNTSLQHLECNNNSLTSLIVSGLTTLSFIDCSYNKFININFSGLGLTSLTKLYCNNNLLTSLNVSGLTVLNEIHCYTNKLTSLDVSTNTTLQYLYCYDNLLISLNVSGLIYLSHIKCYNNQFPSLDVSTNTNLNYLDCHHNSITGLNVSTNTNLNDLYCNTNSLTVLNIAGLHNINYIECSDNKLKSIDVSTNSQLNTFFCQNNLLTHLNVKNGNNTSLSSFNAISNPNLTCIQVDNPTWATSNWTNKDAGASFNVFCGITWTGTTDTEWNTGTNWNPGTVPTIGDDVLIPVVTTYPVIGATTTANCNNLTVNTGASLTIASTSSGTGSLIVSGTSTGTVTCQRYMTAGAWHLVSSPLSGQTVANFLSLNANVALKPDHVRGMMDYDPASNSWNSFFLDGEDHGSLGAGRGFSLRVDASDAVTFTGTLQTGTQSVSGLIQANWNCIGNPYSSAVGITEGSSSSDKFLTINAPNLADTYSAIYIWDKTDGYNGKSGNYIAVSNVPGSYDQVQQGQAFLVNMNASATTISFTPAMQIHSPSLLLKSSNMVWPTIKLVASGNGQTSSTVIAFNSSMNKGLDPGYDAGLLKGGSDLLVYTKLVQDNGISFAIQALPDNDFSNMVIPVGLDFKTGGVVVFSSEVINLPSNCKAILEDKLTKIFTDLSSDVYKATIAANSNISDRFFLHTSNTAGNPISPEKLTAYANRNIEIRLNGTVSKNAVATLFDMFGRVVVVKNLETGSQNIIPTPNLKIGIYLLSVKDNGKQSGIKINVTE